MCSRHRSKHRSTGLQSLNRMLMSNLVAGINFQDRSSREGLLGWIRVQKTKTVIERRAKSRSWVQVYERC